MALSGSDRRISGLTEGLSSKIMRGNRSALLPSLMRMQTNQTERTEALRGRLEELLVFEILKDGGTSYRQFTVRTLYKHVLHAIRHESMVRKGKMGRDLLGQLALGQSIVGIPPQAVIDEGKPLDPKSLEESTTDLGGKSYSHSRPSYAQSTGTGKAEQLAEVTWRERLGAYLHPRDMRKLVTPFSASNEPELIIRRHAMLLNFDPLRTIILRDRLIVLVPDGADSVLVQLEKRIRGEHTEGDPNQSGMTESDSTPSLSREDSPAVSETEIGLEVDEDDAVAEEIFMDNEWAELERKEWIDLPFELQSVDAVLSSVSAILAEDVLDLQLEANGIIVDLVDPNSDVGDHLQEALRTMKNSVSEMMSRVHGFNRAIDTLLDDYEDMALMNLSRLLTHPDRFVQPVPQGVLEEESDEPELILEAHLQRGHTLVNALSLVEGQLGSTEDFAARKSDSIRNKLLYINMLISIISMAVAVGSFVGSIFGMNVVNHYEDSMRAFSVIVWVTIAGIFTFVLGVLLILRRMGALPNLFDKLQA
eukprot:Nitzschia sp. Nitz4//scaffold58_size112336//46750//48412//NITZ4_004032-RA/size112336-processed-gene-0.190-mRNA-1//1//CDS//3329554986//9097//frame0